MNDAEITALLRTRGSPALTTLGGEVVDFVQERREVTMHFLATPAMCHSQVIVQGGFITGMLDSAMAYAGIGVYEGEVLLPTLEIKVNFLAIGNAGPMVAKARATRLGRTIGFLEAELFQHDELIATATSTVRLIFPKAQASS